MNVPLVPHLAMFTRTLRRTSSRARHQQLDPVHLWIRFVRTLSYPTGLSAVSAISKITSKLKTLLDNKRKASRSGHREGLEKVQHQLKKCFHWLDSTGSTTLHSMSWYRSIILVGMGGAVAARDTKATWSSVVASVNQNLVWPEQC